METKKNELKAAVYTRKSSEYGLEQEFNSLAAQREAGEAYIVSQKSEGWVIVPDQYDDGGISGGTMERPALLRLLKDMEAGKVDIIVVYKVDRLTRSLSDFSRIIDMLDNANASFVSVTQQFNTSSSMGRLTLNVLLSFSQFERELTPERIRDKIYASRKRGMWMGGSVPLGYDAIDKKLSINEEEAKDIRTIFNSFIKLGSMRKALRFITKKGIRSKKQKCGNHSGGIIFSDGHFRNILINPTYIGKVRHNDEIFEGNHEAIVDMGTWEKTQALIKANAVNRRHGKNVKYPNLLTGLLFLESGEKLTSSHCTKNNKRYRYYMLGAKNKNQLNVNYGAELIEDTIRNHLYNWLHNETNFDNNASEGKRFLIADEIKNGTPFQQKAQMQTLINQITLCKSKIKLILNYHVLWKSPGDIEKLVEFEFTARIKKTDRHTKSIIPSGKQIVQRRNYKLIKLIADAQEWLMDLKSGKFQSIAEIANKNNRDKSIIGKGVRLSFLAPDIIEAIMEGHQPTTLTVTKLRELKDLPAEWEDQRKVLGIM
ncbi:recombinase family protein [Emcibacteraceae bacterium]|nr:recombinase family protein [Emcibacteraceae bacterium]